MEAAEFVKSHTHHAFLSYNTRDVQLVSPIENALRRAGLEVYFAPEDLLGGIALTQEMARKIELSGCFVLFIGPSGIGAFQRLEVQHALGQQKTIIKVILPGGSPDAILDSFNSRPLDCSDPAVCHQLIDLLIKSITGMTLIRQPLQIGTDWTIKLPNPRPGFGDLILTVHSLCNPDPAHKLLLNWVTLGKLIENLREQIETYSSFYPDVHFGINPAGLAAVQFLNKLRAPVGFIHHEGGQEERRIVAEKCVFPKPKANPRIILAVDSRLKSGSGMKMAVRDSSRTNIRNPTFTTQFWVP